MRFRLVSSYLGAVLLGLIIGFFAGREYLKYELRNALNVTFSDIKRELAVLHTQIAPTPTVTTQSSTTKPIEIKPTSPPSTPAPKEPTPVEILLMKKGFKARNLETSDFEDDITLVLSITNVTGRDIRAFDGIVHFTDLLYNEVMPMKLAINEPIAAGAAITWNGMIKYNQFLEHDQRLRAADQKHLKLIFIVTKVLFSDGTISDYSGH